MPAKSDLIRKLFAAYLNRERHVLEELFADDFKFTSPYDDAIDKTAYFARCWPISASGRMKNSIERTFEQGEEAFVTYCVVTGDGDTFRNTEFFRFAGDKVKSIDVYFGATYRNGKFAKKKEE